MDQRLEIIAQCEASMVQGFTLRTVRINVQRGPSPLMKTIHSCECYGMREQKISCTMQVLMKHCSKCNNKV